MKCCPLGGDLWSSLFVTYTMRIHLALQLFVVFIRIRFPDGNYGARKTSLPRTRRCRPSAVPALWSGGSGKCCWPHCARNSVFGTDIPPPETGSATWSAGRDNTSPCRVPPPEPRNIPKRANALDRGSATRGPNYFMRPASESV